MAEEVIEDVLWTSTAKVTFNNIVEYLRKEWTDKEVENFVTTTSELIANNTAVP